MGDFEINFEVPPQYAYHDRLNIVKEFEQFITDHQEEWGVRFYVCRLRSTRNNGDCDVYFEEETPIPQEEILAEAKKQLPQLKGVRASIGWEGSGDRNSSFNLQLHGERTATLETLSERILPMIERIDGVISVETELEDDERPEIQLILNRDALARYGISARNVAWTVASALRSNYLQKQIIDDNEVDVVARFQYQDRADLDVLLNFPVISPTTMNTIPLSHLVEVKNAPTLGSIKRTNRKTSFPLTINISPGAEKREVRSKTNSMLQLVQFPDGYGFIPPFDVDELTDQSAMFLSLFMSVALVFLIMGALFESFLLPLAIITTIPMAIFGAYWSLYLSGSGMDNIAVIGMVILIGVVVNNGIVLIELVNRLRSEGKNRIEALIEAGERRFRPILMTTLTTIFGLLPMAFGTPTPGSISYTSLGRVVVGGMTAGTLLTLFFVPLLYLALDDMRNGAGKWVGWIRNKEIV
jgi:HAE1 family hydrophobic/amphiphilic exporter-1